MKNVKSYQFSLMHLIVATALVGVAMFTWRLTSDVLKTEPFKEQPPFHWGEYHGKKL